MSGKTRIGPGIRTLDEPLKSIAEFEVWKYSVLYNLKLDPDNKPYLNDDFVFGIKSTLQPHRSLEDDPGTDGKQTAEQKCAVVDFMLDTISQYLPKIPRNDIVLDCSSLRDVWEVVRLHSNIESSGALLNEAWNITRMPNETPQALYSRLKQAYDDNLIRKSSLIYRSAVLTVDEVLSPTLHCTIILHWLNILHPKLRDRVTQRFSTELRTRSYAAIWPEISHSVDSLLKELSSDGTICRFNDSAKFSDSSRFSNSRSNDQSRFSNSQSRARGSYPRSRGLPSLRPTQFSKPSRPCDYCRMLNRRAYYTHSIEDCKFLEKERQNIPQFASRAIEADEYEFDEHQEEFYEEYPDDVRQLEHYINQVSVSASPVITMYCHNKPVSITLDSGGTCNIMDENTAQDLQCHIRATSQRARMADGCSNLTVVGETDVDFQRHDKTFRLTALVCKIAEPSVIGGMPFMMDNDISIRPAKSEVIIEGREVIKYQPVRYPKCSSKRIEAYTVRSPSNTVILPGESAQFQLPKHVSTKFVAVEPRFDNKHNLDAPKVWPPPQVQQVKQGVLTLTNSYKEPVVVKKNSHICNVQSMVPAQLCPQVQQCQPVTPKMKQATRSFSKFPRYFYSKDSGLQQSDHPPRAQRTNSSPKVQKVKTPVTPPPKVYQVNTSVTPPVSEGLSSKKTSLYSSPVVLNPDGILSPEEAAKFTSVLKSYDDVFNPAISTYNGKSGKCFVEVNMGPQPPPQHKGRVPFYGRSDMNELQDKFDALQEKGVFCRPQDIGVTVEMINPSFLVKKKSSNDKRLVTDFGSISSYCRPTPTLMPDVDTTLRRIASWKLIIKSDLTEAYFQLLLKRCSMKWCGVVSPTKGVLVYTRGCMGLPGTECALEELTCLMFGKLVREGKVAKLADDLIVGGNTPEELLQNWEEVLSILRFNNIRLSAKKTVICPASVVILGWTWTNGYLKANSHSLSALNACPPPATAKALKSYIGAYRFLARVIRNYASLLLPLEQMLSGNPAPNTKLVWSPEQLHAFELAKSALKDAQSVVLPKPEDELQIITDGALQPTAVGAVLYVIREGKPLLGGFFNSKLPLFQRRWLPCEIEGVSIGAALNHFAPYILQSDHKPTVITDSKACVDAVQKLRRGEFSVSARLCTFLSSVSRYQAEVKHIQGTNNVVSDYISRNPVTCDTPSCQVCSFLRDSIDSVVGSVKSISVSDVLDGLIQLPFTNKGTWAPIQEQCPDLRNVIKFLTNGTRPGRKGRNLRQVKRYLNANVVISDHGTLVVRQVEPFNPVSERIVVPQQVLHGILTALHLKLEHPTCLQLTRVFNRYFYALYADKAISQCCKSCHVCASLKTVPNAMREESTDSPPEYFAHKFAADIIKRNSQLIMVLRESLSSYTQAEIVRSETVPDLVDALIRLSNLVRPSKLTSMVIKLDPHPSHKSMFTQVSNAEGLARNNIQLEIGRELNINHNPIAEKAVRELIREMLVLCPEGGAISPTALSEAVAALNSRIRAPGISAHEFFTQRDQNTGGQFLLDDMKLIHDQFRRRMSNHEHSERSKAHNKPPHPTADIHVGDIVYRYDDKSKLVARPRYLVLEVEDRWCKVKRFSDKRLGHITYSLKTSECYKVPDEFEGVLLPPYHQEDDQEEVFYDAVQQQPESTIPVLPIPENPEFPCLQCHTEVSVDDEAMQCDVCDLWCHRQCSYMSAEEYKFLQQQEDFDWTCAQCPEDEEASSDESLDESYATEDTVHQSGDEEPQQPALRTSGRVRKPPDRFTTV